MKKEEQIKEEVTIQIVNETRTRLNDELTDVERQFEDTYKNILTQEIEYALDIAETGLTKGTRKSVNNENKRLQQQLVNLRTEKEKIENKLKALKDFD